MIDKGDNYKMYPPTPKNPGNIISAPHYSTPNLLSCTAFRSFNLSWPSDDRFVLLTDSGKEVFDWTSGDTLDIRGIGVRSGWGNDATWIVNHKAHTSGHYRGLKSTYGNMNLLRTTFANSLILCILVCDRDNNCIGINFHLKTKKCELIEGGQLIKKTANSEWMFYTKCLQGSVLIEDWLISTLLQDYNKLAYPGTTDNATVVVKHDMTLIRIVEFDGTKLTIDAWLGTEWRDPRFLWDSSPTNIRLPISQIWTPDIVLYDNPDTRLRFEPNAVIDQSGHVYYCQPIRLEVDNCRQFQDVFTCTLKFGSWTYDGFKIDLQNRSQVIDLSNFQLHTNYDIIDTSVVRNELHYACCPEPYPDITYTVNLKKIKTGWFDRL
ncbi:unnamed protein product [Mytilus edulis]|uniref:Uncharacterized protein n=1 Tax=Mytilus edulis TaxID=6550 RepID=A0A8S3T9A1_MYTED|nr:unnamed protein product [Mytilus edulis]